MKSDGAPRCWACGDEMDRVFAGVWICLECDVVMKDDDPGVISVDKKREVANG